MILYHTPPRVTFLCCCVVQDSGLWALGGGTFRKLLRDHAERHQAQHLHLLERIHILDGLSNVQKVNVGAAPLTAIYGQYMVRRINSLMGSKYQFFMGHGLWKDLRLHDLDATRSLG